MFSFSLVSHLLIYLCFLLHLSHTCLFIYVCFHIQSLSAPALNYRVLITKQGLYISQLVNFVLCHNRFSHIFTFVTCSFSFTFTTFTFTTFTFTTLCCVTTNISHNSHIFTFVTCPFSVSVVSHITRGSSSNLDFISFASCSTL